MIQEITKTDTFSQAKMDVVHFANFKNLIAWTKDIKAIVIAMITRKGAFGLLPPQKKEWVFKSQSTIRSIKDGKLLLQTLALCVQIYLIGSMEY